MKKVQPAGLMIFVAGILLSNFFLTAFAEQQEDPSQNAIMALKTENARLAIRIAALEDGQKKNVEALNQGLTNLSQNVDSKLGSYLRKDAWYRINSQYKGTCLESPDKQSPLIIHANCHGEAWQKFRIID